MCCLTTIFLVLSSRITILLWWLAEPQRINLAYLTEPSVPHEAAGYETPRGVTRTEIKVP